MKRHNGIEWDDGGRWTDANNAESRIASLEAERDDLKARLAVVNRAFGQYEFDGRSYVLPKYDGKAVVAALTSGAELPDYPCPGCEEKDAAIVNCYDTLEKRNEECAEKDKRLARARDVVKLLHAELSAPVSATYAIRWNHVAAIMSDLTDALDGAEEQEEG